MSLKQRPPDFSLLNLRPRERRQIILQTCESQFAKLGFVNYTEIGRILNTSRQTIQLQMKRALAQGDIDQETFDRLKPPTNTRHQTFKTILSNDNATFVCGMAETMKVRKAQIIDTAVTEYRKRQENAVSTI